MEKIIYFDFKKKKRINKFQKLCLEIKVWGINILSR